MAAGQDVYCTLVMNDAYLAGAAVLAHSLRDSSTKHKLAVLVTPDSLLPSTLSELRASHQLTQPLHTSSNTSQTIYNYVLPVPRVSTPNISNLYLMARPDLIHTFTKINLWRQTQFRRIVYIDADVVALRAPDELFDLPDAFAAAPDIGWPDAFNTGVMALTPHMGDYWALQTLASAGDSFDGADQGLLNQYYEHKPWKRLSFAYNCTPHANYQYEPAYRYYKHKISLVHFLGKGKPWLMGRRAPVASGAYQELLARWWSVWDRHFGGDVGEYAAMGRGGLMLVEERSRRDAPPSTIPAPPEATVTTTEAPFTEPGDALEELTQGFAEPLPTVEVRRFSAPHMEWDATRTPPPTTSKPEAANFPSQVYTFNTDPTPFVPPVNNPAPPNVHFAIPSTRPKHDETPPPIFPWEERAIPKPTRTFAPDTPSPQTASGEASPIFSGTDELEVSAGGTPENTSTPTTPSIKVSATPWETFGTGTKNAWDEVQGIDSYVRALSAWQKSRSNPGPQVLSPSGEQEQDPVELIERAKGRRESLILTDFPTAVERPSLPVTPAPRRRNFWGDEGEGDGQGEGGGVFLKGADGVPRQEDWDPNEQLEQLRRNSSLMGLGSPHLKLPERKAIPQRAMPASSGPIEPTSTGHPVADAETSVQEPVSSSGSGTPHGLKPTGVELKGPKFGDVAEGGKGREGEEKVLSPTEHGEE